MFGKIRVLIYVLFIILPGMAVADTVHDFTLPNGLRLFVKEDHRAPVVVSQVWYKVGSSYEHGGITGISHALEHMMFKGTAKYGPGELSRIVAENGGDENAFTDYDYTAYYQVLDAKKLPISFMLEADRMKNLTLSPQEFAKEIQVVMEERRMRIEDNPQALLFERFMAAAYVNNPYHHMVIGWMTDLQHMSADDLRTWYKNWYTPNNALIVVVGDVKADEVYKLAQQYFGQIKSSPVPTLKPRTEIPSLGERTVVVKAPAEVPWIIIGYNVPSLKNDTNSNDPYALEVISALLSGGDSARLPTRLVRGQQIASDASAGYSSLYNRMSSLFILEGTPAQGHTVSQLKTALLQEIKQLQNTPVNPAELERVKAEVIADKVYKQDSISDQAIEIGSLEAVGLPWQLNDAYVKKIESVTPQQIQAAAKKYLTSDNQTVGILEPLPLPANYTPPAPALGDTHVR